MTSKELTFISDLISYKPICWLLRIVFVGIIGLSFLFIANDLAEGSMPVKMPYLSYSLTFIFITEINVLFNNLLAKYGPQKLREYLFSTQLLFNIGLTICTFSLLLPILEEEEITKNPYIELSALFILIFIAFLIITITLLRTLRYYIISQQEIENLRQAQNASEYQALVEQVNPHFLFNNLSVLKSLILYDQTKAVDFTQNFTDIYRYVLQTKDKDVVLLNEELNFVKAYIALHKERIGDGLDVTFDIATDCLSKSVIPISLQILIENAIKHNIASKNDPLHITIKTENDAIIVTNNLNRKETVYSTKKGLENISKRYQILSDKQISIQRTETEFTVILPLI